MWSGFGSGVPDLETDFDGQFVKGGGDGGLGVKLPGDGLPVFRGRFFF